jgi:hypothetical protein
MSKKFFFVPRAYKYLANSHSNLVQRGAACFRRMNGDNFESNSGKSRFLWGKLHNHSIAPEEKFQTSAEGFLETEIPFHFGICTVG